MNCLHASQPSFDSYISQRLEAITTFLLFVDTLWFFCTNFGREGEESLQK